MSQTSKRKNPPPGAKSAAAPRRTKWWAYLLLILVLALAWPVYRFNVSSQRLAGAQDDMALGRMEAAIGKLEAEAEAQPQSGKVAYWLAVAHRRAGHIQTFNELIAKARDLKYSPEEIERQILLSWLQSGETNDGIERHADILIKKAENYTEGRLDLFIDEFYEARSRGFLANFRLIDAEVTLDHWIEVRPQSIQARMLRANVKERQISRFQAAEQEYREILEMEPRNIEARVQFARMLLLNQQVPDAAAQYEICLESAPDDIRVQLGLAECEYRGGKKLDAARARLEKLLTQEQPTEDRAKTLLLLGEIARSKGKHELVIKYLSEATELSPTLGAAPYRSLSSAYASLQLRSRAEEYLAIANRKTDQQTRLGHLMEEILHDPMNADLRYQQGEMFSEEKNRDQAAIWWKMAVRFDPEHLPAHASLAEYYTEKKDQKLLDYHREMAAKAAPTMADRLWKELMREEHGKVQKGLPWLFRYPDLQEEVELLTLGLAVAEGRDLVPTKDRLQQLSQNPRLKLSALTLLGEAHRRLGNYSKAREAFEQVLASSPENASAHLGLQSVCRDTGSFAEMESHALKVAELNTNDFRPHRALGELHKRNESWTQAIHEFQESLRLKPNQHDKDEVLLDLAECLTMAKNFSQALGTLKDIKASSKKSYLEARCRYESKDVERAKQLLDAVLKLSPDQLSSVMLRVDIALASNETEVAEKLLSRAVRFAPHSSEPHRKYAVLLRQKGETDAAIAEDQIAVECEALKSQMDSLIKKASQNPKDVSPRIELAIVAKKLGRDEEAEHWDSVVKGMKGESDQPSLGTTLPKATSFPQKLILAPAETKGSESVPSPPESNNGVKKRQSEGEKLQEKVH